MATEVICVLGGGSFGSTVARIMSVALRQAAGSEAILNWWIREPDIAEEINSVRTNSRFLPGAHFLSNVRATTDLAEAASGATIIVVAIPSQYLPQVLSQLQRSLEAGKRGRLVVLSVVKSLHYDAAAHHLSLPSSTILQYLGAHDLCVLCGPNIYSEMVNDDSFAEASLGYIASSPGGRAAADRLLPLLRTQHFVARPVADRAGVEAAGALKNIVALGVGFAEGAGHGANCRAVLIRLGLAEMAEFACRFLGASSAHTFLLEACGVGDLVLTCTAGRGHRLAAKYVEGGEHVIDPAPPRARWAKIEEAMFAGMRLPDWHSAEAMRDFLTFHACAASFPLFAAIGRVAYDRQPASHLLDAVREALTSSPTALRPARLCVRSTL